MYPPLKQASWPVGKQSGPFPWLPLQVHLEVQVLNERKITVNIFILEIELVAEDVLELFKLFRLN
jgi:hypothetical protein